MDNFKEIRQAELHLQNAKDLLNSLRRARVAVVGESGFELYTQIHPKVQRIIDDRSQDLLDELKEEVREEIERAEEMLDALKGERDK